MKVFGGRVFQAKCKGPQDQQMQRPAGGNMPGVFKGLPKITPPIINS